MKKYRLFGKIPVFDFVIVLLVLIACVIGFFVFSSSKSGKLITETKTENIRYTVAFKNISKAITNLPQEGEKVKDFTTNFDMGTVVSVKTEPHIVYDYDMVTGETVSTIFEDKYDIILEIEAVANVSERCTEINTVRIGIGKSLTLSMPRLCAVGVISNIVEVND